MAFTSVQVVNEALNLIAAQAQITSLTDGSAAANVANAIYVPTVQLMLREIDPDFARYTKALTIAVTPPDNPSWTYEYLYPADCVRLRQVRPSAGAYDPYDPQPVRANVAFDIIAATNTKVIYSNQINALAVYTSSSVTEAQWDAAFFDAVVRRLANPLAMGLNGRPEFAREVLAESAQMAQTCEDIDEGGFRKR